MFNVLKFDNNKKKNKHDLRLITLNNSFDNKIYLYILLSIFKNKLNNFNGDELNEISNEYKKLLNKHVKKNYDLKYLNLNIKKNKINKENFNILSELLNLNITIFGKKELLLFKSSTEYKKSIYFLLKNKKLYLIAEKKNNSLTYQFKHKVLSGGVRNSKRAKVDAQIIPRNNIGLWNPRSNNNWYSIEQVNDFLKKNCEICNSETGEAFKAASEIIIATFTNINRERIYNIIRNINILFERHITLLNSQLSRYLSTFISDNEINSIVLVLSGGDAFNNLLDDEKKRPVSPDIDCKLVINCKSGVVLHGIKNINYSRNLNFNPEIFNIILLLVRNYLNDFLTLQTEELTRDIATLNHDYQNITRNLYQHCILLMGNVENISHLRNKCGNKKILGSFKRRFVHMEAGIKAKDKPYRINNVLLYAIDCIYKYETSWTSIAGILDIVISIPGHTGYMLEENYDMVQMVQYNMGESYIYNMRKEYYIKEDNLKMVEYGLRTENKKIIKDFNRIILLLEEDNFLNQDMMEIKHNMLVKIGELKVREDYGCFISTLEELETKIMSLDREGSQSGGGFFDDIYQDIFCDKFKKKEYNSYHFEAENLNDFNDNNINRQEEEYKNIQIQMKKLSKLNRINNRSRVIAIQKGGTNYNNNNNAVMDVKIPKALYYLISDKITNFRLLSGYKKVKDGIMKPIINYHKLLEDIPNQTDEYYKNIITNLNYEKLTELTTKNPHLSKGELIDRSLKENLNSSALYRINNTLFNSWGITPTGKFAQFSSKTSPYKLINKKVSKFIFIKEILLQEIINQININNDVIRQLYFFDIPIELPFSSTEDKLEFNKFINKEIAKCLLHTIMYPFCIEYIREQPLYYRFVDKKYITDDYNASKGFNYEVYKESGYELPNDDVIQQSPLDIFLQFYDLINGIAVQDHTLISSEEIENELKSFRFKPKQ